MKGIYIKMFKPFGVQSAVVAVSPEGQIRIDTPIQIGLGRISSTEELDADILMPKFSQLLTIRKLSLRGWALTPIHLWEEVEA